MPRHWHDRRLAGWVVDGQCRASTVGDAHGYGHDARTDRQREVATQAHLLGQRKVVGGVVAPELVAPNAILVEPLVFHLGFHPPALSQIEGGRGYNVGEIPHHGVSDVFVEAIIHLRVYLTFKERQCIILRFGTYSHRHEQHAGDHQSSHLHHEIRNAKVQKIIHILCKPSFFFRKVHTKPPCHCQRVCQDWQAARQGCLTQVNPTDQNQRITRFGQDFKGKSWFGTRFSLTFAALKEQRKV